MALNNSQFLVLERNNRGLGFGATLNGPDKRVVPIDLTGATDITGVALPVTGSTLPTGVIGVSKGPTFLNLGSNTLSPIGNKVPEKWEGLTIGPKLSDGSFLLLAGTENDYSVTQNSSGNQFDVYLRFSDPDPYAGRIECPIDFTTGCSGANTSVPSNGSYTLLPGVLHAYKTPASDLSGYQAPVPGPLPLLGAASALAWSRRLRLRIKGN